jgi:hypothetical protein
MKISSFKDHMKSIYVIGLLVFSFAATEVEAQTKQREAVDPDRARIQLEQMDSNQDGQIDAQERKTWMVKRRQEQEDGKKEAARLRKELKKAEAAEHYKRLRISTNVIATYDKNRNGIMEPHEWEKHRQDYQRKKADGLIKPKQKQD